MNKKSLAQLAKKIIRDNKYLDLGTSSSNGKPWVAPVYYCVDHEFNFYFASQVESQHVKNLLASPEVSVAIFNSNATEEDAAGVQIEAIAKLISENELEGAKKYYHSDFVTDEMLQNGIYHLFKIIPKRIYVNDPNSKVDTRVEVFLK